VNAAAASSTSPAPTALKRQVEAMATPSKNSLFLSKYNLSEYTLK